MNGQGAGSHAEIACSVVICVRNGAESLGVQLNALARQIGAPCFEVLVVDNGSTDGTADVYRRWAAGGIGRVSSTRLIDAALEPGLAYARNRGAAAAVGEVLAYCDADDWVAPGWLAAAWRAIRDQEHKAVGGQVRTLSGQGPTDDVIMDSLDGITSDQGALKNYPFFWGCSFALTRDAFVAVGGFDESLPPYGCDDIDIGVRLGERGIGIGYVADMIVHYAPPSGFRRRLRRKFRAGIAQACLWERHPDVYRTPSLLNLAAGVPLEVIKSARTPGPGKTRLLRAAEGVASRAGHAWGQHRLVRPGRLGPPRYFEEESSR